MLAALLPVLGPILDKVLGAILPDPAARAKAITDILSQLMQSDLAQLEVDKAEASSGSVFVAGARPFILWCCGVGVAYTYILVPLTMYVGFLAGHPLPKPPVLDNNLWELMFGMLGMGALRSFDKVKGVATKSFG